MGIMTDAYNRTRDLYERIRKIEQEPKPQPQPAPQPDQPKPDQPQPTNGGNNGGNSGGNNGTWVKTEPTTDEVLDFMANSTIYNQVNIAKAKK